MLANRLFAVAVALAATTASATAAPAVRGEWGVGAAVQGKPALSVQYAPSKVDAYHVLTHIGNDTAFFQADYQRFFRPRTLSFEFLTTGVYAGLGLTGEAARDDAPGELWYLHLPVGAQCDIATLHLSVFVEAAAKIGALPGTDLSPAVSGGVRAYF